ncbi:MAG: YggT family protein [Spirochaetia bacterium]
MEAFRIIMRVVTAGLSLYMLMIMFRILLTWFQGPSFGRPLELLKSVTDPYLNWFRRFQFLRVGNFDFSIIVGIIVLSILTSITSRLAVAAVVSFGLVLALIIVRVASAASFFLVLFLIMALIRLIGGALGVNTSGRVWITLDHLLEPVVHKIILALARGRFVSYRNALLLFCALLAMALFAGRFLVDGLVNLVGRIPI